MRKIVHKWFWMWDFEKEEKWLNEMAAKGLSLVSASFCRYDFEECEPGEYRLRMEFTERTSGPELEKYVEFVESTGAEHIGTFNRWLYFRRKAELGEFELYSDNESRVKYLKRIIRVLAAVGGLNLYIGIYNLFLFWSNRFFVNLLGIINLLLGILSLYGVYTISKKVKKLENDSRIFQ